MPAGILWWPKVKGIKNWRRCCWKEKTVNFSYWGERKTFRWLSRPVLCIAQLMGGRQRRMWFPATSAVLSDREAGMPNLHSQRCCQLMECLQHVSSPLWARLSFGVNWDSSLASSEAMLICISWESVPWFSNPESQGRLLTLGVLWRPRDECYSTALGGEWLLEKRGQAKPCLGFGLWPARSRDSSPFPVGPSLQPWCWDTSCPCSLGVDVARYPNPASLEATRTWISYFTKINPYLSAKWAMQRNIGFKKQNVWSSGWIPSLSKHFLPKMPFSVIFQCWHLNG